MLVALDQVDFSYAGETVFQGVTLQLDPGDRLGLVGRNGTGKTTLLKLLAGELEPEHGKVYRQPKARAVHLRQTQESLGDRTVLDAALEPLADVTALEARLAELLPSLAEHPERVEEYGHLHELFERRGGYSAPARAKKVLSGLGFGTDDLDKSCSSLSGGEKNRLALARLLLTDAQLLLLDEPTNHLDVEATEFLEEFLSSDRSGADRGIVVVSHDRRFLDKVVSRTALLERTRLRIFPGGYSRAVQLRAEQRELEWKAYEQQQEHIARTEDFIARNLAGQNTKQAQSRRTQLEKLERLERPEEETRAARIRIQPVQTSEREVLAARNVSLCVGTRTLVREASFVLERGQKIGLVGANGSGKSTLLKALVGERAPDSGSVRMGGRVKVGYYDQEMQQLDPRNSVLDELRLLRVSNSDELLRGWAGRFLFSGDEALRPLASMSGGERARAALAKLTLSGANLLVLDEPTNHLDVASCEALEAALAEYEGTLLCVSHDRFFLDKVVSRVLWIDHERIEDYAGNFSDARAKRRGQEAVSKAEAGPTDAQLAYEERKSIERERQRAKRRAQSIDTELNELEKKVEELTALLADPANANAWEKLSEMHREKDEKEERMLKLMEEREGLGVP
jgi:ATP-binding cassette subfamily F protein 3